MTSKGENIPEHAQFNIIPLQKQQTGHWAENVALI